MALQLAPEEPEAGTWRVELLSTVAGAVTRQGPDGSSSGRPAVLAVDGRSNNGKTTVAARIRDMVPGAVVIHTDDIAWEHSRFGWADLLIDGILVPVHEGRAVSYRPPRWDEHGREGSIEVPASCPLLIIEGDGAGRREVTHLVDTLIWVQADEREAARRSAARAADPPPADLVNKSVTGTPSPRDPPALRRHGRRVTPCECPAQAARAPTARHGRRGRSTPDSAEIRLLSVDQVRLERRSGSSRSSSVPSTAGR